MLCGCRCWLGGSRLPCAAVLGDYWWDIASLTYVGLFFCELVVSAHARSVVDVCRKLLLLPGKGVGFGVFLWAHVVIEVCGSF